MDNGKSEFITKKIKVYGIVQGVGFRPLVYRIAQIYKIGGTVRNVGGYVEITAQGSEEAISDFLQEIKNCKNSGCEIMKLELENISTNEYKSFTIIGSEISEETSIIPPDLPVCPNCIEELYEKSDRRYQNPFISCMSCGPRYTIIEELPYDRQNTTMTNFMMCDSCDEEYRMPESRRFHAQTISCNDCGPYLIFHGSNELINQEALEKAILILQSGGILAVKGIGGYHFVCSPFMEETVNHLRKLKGREEKPFAVMFPSIQEVEKYCMVTDEERALLQTNARPIVLLYHKDNSMAPSTNKGSIYCGTFLPYTPLQLLLTSQCGPLIMTSANISDQPIIREDAAILALSSPYLDGVLYNTRRIVRSVDDSVAKIIDGKPQLIRRSRGYVPYPVFINQGSNINQESNKNQESNINHESNVNHESNINQEINMNQPQSEGAEDNECALNQVVPLRKAAMTDDNSNIPTHKMILAAGGDLKAAFCLYKNGKAVLSQYFGDLEEITVFEEYKKSLTDLQSLLKIDPELAVCDLHPNYHTVNFFKTFQIPILQVQHHHAHIASVMAEHDLKGPVIGIAFDGTGYGNDGNIWGGEFLVCEGADFIRAAHLRNTSIIGGDQSMKDARKTASCYLINSGLNEFVRDDHKDIIETALEHRVNTVQTSSMGRLFDAVASVLNIGQENRYEGECAALLEREAVLAIRNQVRPEELTFAISQKHEIMELDPKPLFESICNLRDHRDIGSLALGFHYAVAEAVGEICERIRNKYHCNTVALSGGVFQNTVLTQKTLSVLRQKNFHVYGNMAVPPNDGGICLGQTYIALQNKLSVKMKSDDLKIDCI